MATHEAFASAVAASLNEAVKSPKCGPQESAALTEAALVAIRRLVRETRGAGEKSVVEKWRHAFDAVMLACKTRSEFLAAFATLTLSFDYGASFEGLCVHTACESALLAADAEVPRRFRLDALHDAGIATGALAMLVNPGAMEQRVRAEQAQKAADARHKDSRADRAHVADWLQKNRDRYKTDVERVDAIMAGNEVGAKRSTVARWVTEWNRAQRAKKIAER